MSKICSVCSKGGMSGNKVSHSNRKTPRILKPNLQKVRILATNGAVSSEYVCMRCLKGGKVSRA